MGRVKNSKGRYESIYSVDATCSVVGCETRPKGNGMCGVHYNRWYQLGDPLAPPRQKKREVHGLTHHSMYGTWQQMIDRCNNPRSPSYSHYGARGITVCERWLQSFTNFLADMGERPEGMTVDRIDVNGNYEPNNCRWATITEQQKNKTTNKNNTSGRKGVHHNKRGYYEVHIGKKFVGNFNNFDDAVAARERAERENGYTHAI